MEWKPAKPPENFAPPTQPEIDPETGKFSHPLKESLFQAWYKHHAKTTGMSTNPDDIRHHYDFRKAFKADVSPNEHGHWDSRFKKASHPDRFLRTQTERGTEVHDTSTGKKYIEE